MEGILVTLLSRYTIMLLETETNEWYLNNSEINPDATEAHQAAA